MFTSWPEVAEDPKVAAAADRLSGVIAEQYVSDLMRWLEVKPDEPEEWQQAAQFGDTFMYVTASELSELAERTRELADAYLDRQTDPALRPPGARLVSYVHIAHPLIERRPEQPDEGQDS